MVWLLAFLVCPSQAPEEIGSLVERWKSDDVTLRDRAFDDVLARWGEWKEADLATLGKSSGDPDQEVAARAREALERIRLRRLLGRDVLGQVPGVDLALLRGSEEERTGALKVVVAGWQKGSLKDSDLGAVARMCVEGGAKVEPARIFHLLEQPADPALLVLALPFLSHEEVGIRRQALKCIGDHGGPEHGSFLVPLLRDAESGLRVSALRTVCRLKAKVKVDVIVPLLKDPDDSVRESAAAAMAELGRERARDLVPVLRDEKLFVRMEAADALVALAAPETVPDLLPLLRDEDEWIRRSAARILGVAGQPEHAADLRPLLRDRDYKVRRVAVSSMADLAGASSGPEIAPLLGDPDPTVQAGAAGALAQIRAEAFGPSLVPLLKAGHSDVRAAACMALARLGPRSAAREILPLLEDDTASVRTSALGALVCLDAREHAAEILRRRRDRDREVRETALWALSEFGSPEAADELPEYFKTRTEKPDYVAQRAIGLIGSTDCARRMLKLLADEGELLPSEMAALLRTNSPDLVPALLPMLRNGNPKVRSQALEVLGGLRAREGAAAVARLLEDPEERVQRAAVGALGKMRVPEHSGSLVKKLRGPVGSRAVRALAEMGAADRAGELLPFLLRSDEDDRREAAEAIGHLGPRISGEETRLRFVRALTPLRKDDSRSVRIASTFALICLGGEDSSTRSQFLREFSEKGWKFVPSEFAEGLLRRFEPEGFRKMEQERFLEKSIDSTAALKAFVEESGLRLEPSDSIRLVGRWNAGGRLSVRRAMESVAIREEEFYLQVVLEGATVRALRWQESLEYWRRRLLPQ